MTDLKLSYAELIASPRVYDVVLSPREIPIHPQVYNSSFAYTPEFMTEVQAQMPQALHEDISAIERILQVETGITVTDKAMKWRSEELRFEEIPHEAKPQTRQLSIGIYASTIGILPHLPTELMVFPKSFIGKHPLPLEKARAYAFREEPDCLTLHTWYTHNIHDQGELLFQYLRTFAIVFNNCGLSRLQ